MMTRRGYVGGWLSLESGDTRNQGAFDTSRHLVELNRMTSVDGGQRCES
jgi:hypothetical protein